MAAAGIVLLLIVVLAVRCSATTSENADKPSGEQSIAAQASGQVPSSSQDSSDVAKAQVVQQVDGAGAEMRDDLVNLIGEEEADKLLEAAGTNTQTLWIAAHPEEYAFDGIEVQAKILKLAAEEPQAIPFVRAYPAQYPAAEPSTDESLALPTESPSSDVPNTKIPHLYQWDRRWGNTVYSSAAFGLTGCGPASLAMVYQGLTGKADISPYDMAVIAESNGYMTDYNGTVRTFFTAMAGDLGLKCESLNSSTSNLTEALSSGKVIIAHLEPGIFTERGHFFVLAGLAENGEVILNDPYSYERSSVTWPVETIAQESDVCYAYSLA